MPFDEILNRLTSRQHWLAKLESTLGEAAELLVEMDPSGGSEALRREILVLKDEVAKIRNGATERLVPINPFRMESPDDREKGGEDQTPSGKSPPPPKSSR